MARGTGKSNVYPFRRARRAPLRKPRRDRPRRGGVGVRIGRFALFGGVAFVVGLRLIEIATGYATPTTGCRVTGVVDGDTVRLSCPDRNETRGRLLGFDTPEVFSPDCSAEWRRGLAATLLLRRDIWSAGHIETRARGTDRYGRLLIALYLDGENVADRMVAAGLARRYDGGLRGSWCE